jgi:hypothetical protein
MPEPRVEVVETNFTPNLTKDRSRRLLLLLLLFGPPAGEREDDGREESREGEAA